MALLHAGLNLEKVEIVLMQQISGPTAPTPAPAPAAQAPLIDKIIGLPITPPAPSGFGPTAAPIQQSAVAAAPPQSNKNTIIIAVVCVVGAAGESRISQAMLKGVPRVSTRMGLRDRHLLKNCSRGCSLLLIRVGCVCSNLCCSCGSSYPVASGVA